MTSSRSAAFRTIAGGSGAPAPTTTRAIASRARVRCGSTAFRATPLFHAERGRTATRLDCARARARDADPSSRRADEPSRRSRRARDSRRCFAAWRRRQDGRLRAARPQRSRRVRRPDRAARRRNAAAPAFARRTLERCRARPRLRHSRSNGFAFADGRLRVYVRMLRARQRSHVRTEHPARNAALRPARDHDAEGVGRSSEDAATDVIRNARYHRRRASPARTSAHAVASLALRRTMRHGRRAAARANPRPAPKDRRSCCKARRGRRDAPYNRPSASCAAEERTRKRTRAQPYARASSGSEHANRENREIVAQPLAAARAHRRHQLVGELLARAPARVR